MADLSSKLAAARETLAEPDVEALRRRAAETEKEDNRE